MKERDLIHLSTDITPVQVIGLMRLADSFEIEDYQSRLLNMLLGRMKLPGTGKVSPGQEVFAMIELGDDWQKAEWIADRSGKAIVMLSTSGELINDPYCVRVQGEIYYRFVTVLNSPEPAADAMVHDLWEERLLAVKRNQYVSEDDITFDEAAASAQSGRPKGNADEDSGEVVSLKDYVESKMPEYDAIMEHLMRAADPIGAWNRL